MKNEQDLSPIQKEYIGWINYVCDTDDDVETIAKRCPLSFIQEGLLESREFNKTIDIIRRKRKIKQIQKKLIK